MRLLIRARVTVKTRKYTERKRQTARLLEYSSWVHFFRSPVTGNDSTSRWSHVQLVWVALRAIIQLQLQAHTSQAHSVPHCLINATRITQLLVLRTALSSRPAHVRLEVFVVWVAGFCGPSRMPLHALSRLGLLRRAAAAALVTVGTRGVAPARPVRSSILRACHVRW